MININMNKAKDIWRDKVRAERNEELAKLDVLYMRSLEANDVEAQQIIASKKQALRDAPADPRIENASTVEELKDLNLIGEIINGE